MTRKTCRACGAASLLEVLDMGPMPLAGDFRQRGEANELFPLAIDACAECGILQVREMVDPSRIFTPGYSFSSTTVPALVRHFHAYAQSVARPSSEKARPKVLEVGCNDGVFLAPLRDAGYDVVGIDASDNVAALARAKGFDVKTGFFTAETARALRQEHGAFDTVTCSNVFAHNPDVNGFIEAAKIVLHEKGEFWIEVHNGADLKTGLQWDCFYHEHAFYWTIQALQRRLGAHGFRLTRWTTTPMHGGAIRAAFARASNIGDLVPHEISPQEWTKFGEECQSSRVGIRSAIEALPIRYAYGAAGRAVTLINWTGIGKRLEFVVDGSPLRYGRVVPNTDVPVISEAEFATRPTNEWCFVTAHNYLDDIRRKVEAIEPTRHTNFVTPLPYVTIR